LIQVERICDEELLLRGLLFSDKPEPKYIDKGALTSYIFTDPDYRPSVHMGKYANFVALVEEEPRRFAFAVLLANDVRIYRGEVIHEPNEHDSHAVIVPPPEISSQNQIRRWRGVLTGLVWDLIFIPERVEQFRTA